MLAYAVVLSGMESGKSKGNIYELGLYGESRACSADHRADGQ